MLFLTEKKVEKNASHKRKLRVRRRSLFVCGRKNQSSNRLSNPRDFSQELIEISQTKKALYRQHAVSMNRYWHSESEAHVERADYKPNYKTTKKRTQIIILKL